MKRITYVFTVFLILFQLGGCIPKELFSCRGEVYTASSGEISFSVSARTAGRLVSFRYGEEEMLLQADIDSSYYGSTFWLSPQEWHWPPYPVLDEWPYRAVLQDDKLKLYSPSDSVKGIEVTKEFSFSDDKAVLITCSLKNISTEMKRLALWDVTRVPGGITFFPVGEPDKANRSFIPNAYEQDGIVWYEIEIEPVTDSQKLFSTAKGGWLAHYRNGVLMVKCFPDILPSQLPPGHGEVEVFVAPHGKYVELENHGEYVALKPGEQLQYKEKWLLLAVAPVVATDKSKLLDIVEHLDKKIP